MIDAAVKALAQLFTPPLRAVLLKAIGLALLMIIIIGIVLNRVFSALAASGVNWAEQTSGFAPHAVWTNLAWVMSIMAGFGIITGALFLMPAVAAFVGSFFVDEVADAVEREAYPAEQPGRALPLLRALIEGVKFARAGARGLSLRAAVHIFRRARRHHFISWQILICSAANISNLPPCASTRWPKPKRYARPTPPIFSSPA